MLVADSLFYFVSFYIVLISEDVFLGHGSLSLHILNNSTVLGPVLGLETHGLENWLLLIISVTRRLVLDVHV